MKFYFTLLVLTLSLNFLSHEAMAQVPQGLVFENARIFLPVKGGFTTAGYALIKNESGQEISLIIVETAPFKAVEAHETLEKEGKMIMQKVDQLVIKAKNRLELKPGGSHLMFFDSGREIKLDETLKVKFKANEKLFEVPFKIIARLPN